MHEMGTEGRERQSEFAHEKQGKGKRGFVKGGNFIDNQHLILMSMLHFSHLSNQDSGPKFDSN